MGEGADPPEPESAFVGDENGKDVASEEKPEEFTITFEDITVHVPEIKGCVSCCSSKDNPFKNYGAEYFGMSVEERAAFYTLDRVSGLVKSGEVSVLADGFDSKGNEFFRRPFSTINCLCAPSHFCPLLASTLHT